MSERRRHPLDLIILGRDPCRKRGLPDLPEIRSMWRLAFWQGFWGWYFGGKPFGAEMERRSDAARAAILRATSETAAGELVAELQEKWGLVPAEFRIDEVANHPSTPASRAFFDALNAQLRERDQDGP